MWTEFLKRNVLKPGLERLGTVAATMLVFGGDWLCQNLNACGLVTQEGAHTVVTYVTAVALLVFDLVVVHLNRKGKG